MVVIKMKYFIFPLIFLFILVFVSTFIMSIPEDFDQECSVFGGSVIKENLTGYENCLEKGFDSFCLINRVATTSFYSGLNCEGPTLKYENTISGILSCSNKPESGDYNFCTSPMIIKNDIPQDSQRDTLRDEVVCCRKIIDRANLSDIIGTVYLIYDDNPPTSLDVAALGNLQVWLQSKGISSEILRNSQVTNDMLKERTATFIYNRKAVVLFGEDVSSSLVLVQAGNIQVKLRNESIIDFLCPDLVKSDVVESDDLKDYLCERPVQESEVIIEKAPAEAEEIEEEAGLIRRFVNKVTGRIVDLFS